MCRRMKLGANLPPSSMKINSMQIQDLNVNPEIAKPVDGKVENIL